MWLHHVSCCALNWIICHLLFPMTKMNGCRREFCVQWFGSRLVFKRHIVPLRSHYPPVSLSSPKEYVNASHFHWDIHQNAVTCFWVGFGFAATKHQPYEDHMVCSPICLTYTHISSAVLYCVAHYIDEITFDKYTIHFMIEFGSFGVCVCWIRSEIIELVFDIQYRGKNNSHQQQMHNH